MRRTKEENDFFNLRMIAETYENELRQLIAMEYIPDVCIPYLYQRFGFSVEVKDNQLADFQIKIVDESENKIRLKLRKRYPNFIKNKVPVVELRSQFGA